MLEALIALVPVLLFKQIIDIIPQRRPPAQVTAPRRPDASVAAVATAGLSFFERWWSSRIGEGLIYDLRVKLFDHVQRLPLAFFTRTQTGALISRMNNDVIGAQRAVTGTLGSVVSNVVVLATTLTAMFILQWQITLLALVLLPLFIIPAKRVGRKLQAITRESFDLNADMNTQMTERFNVSGALLVKLFGELRARGRGVRRPGRPGPRHRRARRHVRPHLLHRPRPGRRGRHRRRLRHRRPPGHLAAPSSSAPSWPWPPS